MGTSRPAARLAPLLVAFLVPGLWCRAQPAPVPEPAPVAAASPIRAALDAMLAEMERAVLAGDGPAYLRHVWTGEPEWAMEQKNWAADLARHVPAEFELTLGEGEIAGPEGEARTTLVTRWRLDDGGVARSVEFPARFVRAEGAWLYAGEDWIVTEAPGVRVLSRESHVEGAKIAARVMPEVRDAVLPEFGLAEAPIASRTQVIKIYPSVRHLQHSIYLSYTDGLAGWNEPGESIKILGRRRGDEASTRMLLAHEFGHVASFELGPRSTDTPWWALEGIAELMAEPYARSGPRVDGLMADMAQNDRLIAWEKLADFRGEARDHGFNVYRQGHSMMRFVTEKYGAESRTAWLAEMATGASLDDSTRKALGVSFAELDGLWREHIGAKKPTDPKEEPKPGGGGGS